MDLRMTNVTRPVDSEEFGPAEQLYPAEQTFDLPRPSGLEKAVEACGASYGLLVGRWWIRLYCSRTVHGQPHHENGREIPDRSWHSAPLADGKFRWPPGHEGVPEPKSW
jgi:hypothetical protein